MSVGLSDQMAAALRAAPGPRHDLRATPATCFWGYFDRAQPPVLSIRSGDVVRVEAITHHAGDAPDLLMDDVVRAVWAGIPEADRGPGVHVMTGPIAVEGAEPGDDAARPDPRGHAPAALRLQLRRALGTALRRVRQGAHHHLRAATATATEVVATPEFAYDFTTRARYDVPGVVDAARPGGPPAVQPPDRACRSVRTSA